MFHARSTKQIEQRMSFDVLLEFWDRCWNRLEASLTETLRWAAKLGDGSEEDLCRKTLNDT